MSDDFVKGLKVELDEAVRRLERGGPKDPLLPARLLEDLGGIYRAMGLWQQAADVHGLSVPMFVNERGRGDPEAFAATNNLAMAYRHSGRAKDAVEVYEEALRAWEARPGADPDDRPTLAARGNLAAAYHELAAAYQEAENLKAALDRFADVVARQEHALPPATPTRWPP